jgi:hypothetical protein
MHRGRGVLISISLPYYNGSALTVFFYKKPSPNSIDTIAVRRRVAGMKQILLMIAVVAAQSGSM